MRPSRYLLLLVSLYLALCGSAFAQHKSGSSSHAHSSSKNSADKTVHVRTYTKKNGTVVKSYDRRPPGSKESVSPPQGTVRSSSPTAALRDSNGRIKRSEAAKDSFVLSRLTQKKTATNRENELAIAHVIGKFAHLGRIGLREYA